MRSVILTCSPTFPSGWPHSEFWQPSEKEDGALCMHSDTGNWGMDVCYLSGQWVIEERICLLFTNVSTCWLMLTSWILDCLLPCACTHACLFTCLHRWKPCRFHLAQTKTSWSIHPSIHAVKDLSIRAEYCSFFQYVGWVLNPSTLSKFEDSRTTDFRQGVFVLILIGMDSSR